MQKKFFSFFIFLFAATTLFAQKPKEVVFPNLPMDEKNEFITYTAVMNIQGTTAQELYERGKNGFSLTSKTLQKKYAPMMRRKKK